MEAALSVMSLHCGCNVATLSVNVTTLIKILSDLAQCRDIRVAMSRHCLDVATLRGNVATLLCCRDIENIIGADVTTLHVSVLFFNFYLFSSYCSFLHT